ncbi:hypothetical protein TKK_0000293 [Trichogramma kaykai]
MKFRLSTGCAEYSRQAQQDASEFFLDLCPLSEELSNILKISSHYRHFCALGHKSIDYNSMIDFTMILTVPHYSSCCVQNLIDNNTSFASETDKLCDAGCGLFFHENLIIDHVNKAAVLQLNIFDAMSNKIKDFHLSDPLHEVIKLKDKSYRVSSVIFHIGTSIQEGHYICMVRVQENGIDIWKQANDDRITIPR